MHQRHTVADLAHQKAIVQAVAEAESASVQGDLAQHPACGCRQRHARSRRRAASAMATRGRSSSFSIRIDGQARRLPAR